MKNNRYCYIEFSSQNKILFGRYYTISDRSEMAVGPEWMAFSPFRIIFFTSLNYPITIKNRKEQHTWFGKHER